MSDENKTQEAEPTNNDGRGVPNPTGTGTGNTGQAPIASDGANFGEQPKPDKPDAYQAIIDQQNAQIAALMEHSSKQAEQIAQLINNGAQLNQQPQQPQQPQQAMPQVQALGADDDYSLEALGKEIGKRNG